MVGAGGADKRSFTRFTASAGSLAIAANRIGWAELIWPRSMSLAIVRMGKSKRNLRRSLCGYGLGPLGSRSYRRQDRGLDM